MENKAPSSTPTKLQQLYIGYNKIFDFVVVITFVSMFLVVVVNVITRFAFNAPLAWSVEFARYAFVWLTFMGATLTMRNGNHMGMDIFVQKLPQKPRLIIKIIVDCLSVVMLIALTVAGLTMVFNSLETKSAVMSISMSIPYFAIPLGAISMVIELFRKVNRSISELKSN